MWSTLHQTLKAPCRGQSWMRRQSFATARNITATSAAKKLLQSRLNKLPPTGCMTKLVCTIGPATDSVEKINALVQNGMSVARLNFSHAGNDYSYPAQCLERIRAAPGKHAQLAMGGAMTEHIQALPNNVRGILVDTKGKCLQLHVGNLYNHFLLGFSPCSQI